jgi:hypothetical protein
MTDEEDGETLQERFQLRSRFSRPRLPHIPHVEDPPTSLEASLPAPPRRPRNVARKCVTKKLKVTETTSQEVSSSGRVVEYLSCSSVYADNCILSCRRRFPRPTLLIKWKEITGTRWASRLRGVAV